MALLAAKPRGQRKDDCLCQPLRVGLSLLRRSHADHSRVARQLDVIRLVVGAPPALASATGTHQPAEVGVVATSKSKPRGLLPRPAKCALVDIDVDDAATTEHMTKTSIVPHVAVARLLQASRGVGADALIEHVNGGVKALIADPQSPTIDLSKALPPSVMSEAPWPLLRTDGPSRAVPRSREGGARRGQHHASDPSLPHLPANTRLHSCAKNISLLSMPDLEFSGCEPHSTCMRGNMANA